jgi:zinc protease
MQERQVGRSQDGGLVRTLARNAQYGWTMKHDSDLESKIAALTPADILAALKRHIELGAVSYFKGGDFQKK